MKLKLQTYLTLALSLFLVACGANQESINAGKLDAENPADAGTGIETGSDDGDSTVDTDVEEETDPPAEDPAQETQLSIYGKFSSKVCFLNKMASEGFGQKVFTKAKLVFRKNGSGRSIFRLYADENCEKELTRGSARLHYQITKTYKEVFVIRVEQQNDPKNKKDISTYWLTAIAQKKGYLFDIDYSKGESGPYLSEPTEEEVTEFMQNAEKKGVYFRKVKNRKWKASK